MVIGFIIDLIIVFCGGSMIYILARALPRVNEFPEDEVGVKTSKFLNYLEKADECFRKFTEKILRRLKVIVMKVDNYLSNKLSSFKKTPEKENDFNFNLKDGESEIEEKPKDEEDNYKFENNKD
jgi:hypothetical protein